MRWLMRLSEFFSSARDTGETVDVIRSAVEQQVESSRGIEATQRNRQANGRLREAVAAVKSSAFYGLEAAAAVKQRDR